MKESSPNDRIESIHDFSVDTDSREIWLIPSQTLSVGLGEEATETGVEWQMAAKFLKNLNLLRNLDDVAPILVHMKTNGGYWQEGMAIYDAIKTCPCPITILSYTHARSMSSLIFCAANKRVMMPNSEFMFHHGEMYYGGTVTQFTTAYEQLEYSKQIMLGIYTEVMRRDSNHWCTKTPKMCEKWLLTQMSKKEDVFLTPEEAIDNGFADEIFEGDYDSLRYYTDEELNR